MGPTAESIAHFIHGVVTAYFFTWTIFIWNLRKQSNMMYMLFLCMAYIAFCLVKDMVFLVDGLSEDFFWSGLSLTVDIIAVPLAMNFFVEVVSPGLVTGRKLLVQVGAQSLFIPLFVIFPTQLMLDIALYSAYLGGICSLVIISVLLARHRKFIRDNYSYTEHVDVTWSIRCIIGLFVCITAYVIISNYETWTSRTILHLLLMVAWLYLSRLARNHSVVKMPPLVMFAFPLVRKTEPEVEDAAVSSEVYSGLAEQLNECMSKGKLYLNPKLTLQDVCTEIGTNRTYLSDYLNNVLNTTFYEYVNELRIRTACEIIGSMTPENKRSMLEISEVSGFNSISTFNRSFVKMMGVTPSQYMSKTSKTSSK